MPFSARQVQDHLTVVQTLEVINSGVIVLDARVDVVHVEALDGGRHRGHSLAVAAGDFA